MTLLRRRFGDPLRHGAPRQRSHVENLLRERFSSVRAAVPSNNDVRYPPQSSIINKCYYATGDSILNSPGSMILGVFASPPPGRSQRAAANGVSCCDFHRFARSTPTPATWRVPSNGKGLHTASLRLGLSNCPASAPRWRTPKQIICRPANRSFLAVRRTNSKPRQTSQPGLRDCHVPIQNTEKPSEATLLR
jgi:hypothetical protein